MLDISYLSVVRNVSKLLDDITLTLEAGQIVAIVGENVAGKSALLLTMA